MRTLPRLAVVQQGAATRVDRYLLTLANVLVLELDKHDVVPTASLPSGGSAQDGKVLIEDAGAGVFNLVLYANGSRFRRDGWVAF